MGSEIRTCSETDCGRPHYAADCAGALIRLDGVVSLSLRTESTSPRLSSRIQQARTRPPLAAPVGCQLEGTT